MAKINKPQLGGRRPAIPVSPAAQQAARAGMAGEQLAAATLAPAPTAPAPAPAAGDLPPVPSSPPLADLAASPTPDVTAPEPAAPSVPVTPAPAPPASARAAPAKRGRKQTTTTSGNTDQPLQSVHLFKGTIKDIKKYLLDLPDGPDTPANIRQFIEAALLVYVAQLRKQGKLPAA